MEEPEPDPGASIEKTLAPQVGSGQKRWWKLGGSLSFFMFFHGNLIELVGGFRHFFVKAFCKRDDDPCRICGVEHRTDSMRVTNDMGYMGANVLRLLIKSHGLIMG